MTEPPRTGQSASVEGRADLRVLEVGASASSHVEFRSIFVEHYGFVWRMLGTFGVATHQRDDAAQEVFAIVHRRLAEFDGRTSLRSWLWGIARRVAAGVHRGELRARRRLEVVVAPDAPATPDESLARAQQIDLVERCLAKLGDEHRDVLVAADIEGFSAPEIAELLGIKLNTVYSRLRVARERFERAVARARAQMEGRP